MFKVTVTLRYPWKPLIPEEEQVSFILSGEYPAASAGEAEMVVRSLIASGEPGWVLDAEGVAWPFYKETVREVRAVAI